MREAEKQGCTSERRERISIKDVNQVDLIISELESFGKVISDLVCPTEKRIFTFAVR